MPVAIADNPTVVRTERGLTIKGTRITLYQIMDYLRANYSREMILSLRQSLSEEELDDALNYIEAHREEIEDTGWAEAMEIRFLYFAEIGLLDDSSDRAVWQAVHSLVPFFKDGFDVPSCVQYAQHFNALIHYMVEDKKLFEAFDRPLAQVAKAL